MPLDRKAEGSQRPLKKLRYFLRHLLKPTDIPQIRNTDLTLELYRRYGHPYTTIAEALEAHATCKTIGVSLKLLYHHAVE